MERLRQTALFAAVILPVTFLAPTKSLAQFGGPPRKTTCSELKEVCKELEPYKEKVQEMAWLLLEGVEYDFQVKIDFDLVYRRSAMRFNRNICTIGISAKQVKDEIKTEAGLAGVLAHELGHCFQHSEGELPPAMAPHSHFGSISPETLRSNAALRLERETDAERRGIALTSRNPVYATRYRRIMMENRLSRAIEKRRSDQTIKAYKERWRDQLLFLSRLSPALRICLLCRCFC